MEVLDVGAGGDDLAGEFVTHYEARRGGLVAAEDMELTGYRMQYVSSLQS